MIALLIKVYESFRNRPDLWFFYAFLGTSTLSARKVLFFYPVAGVFNEYTGIYIYLSDIFLFLTLTAWLLSLYNISSFLSNTKTFLSKLFHAYHADCSTWNNLWIKKLYQQVAHNYLILFPLFLAIFSFLSILWAINKPVALFRSIKLLEFTLLYFYIIQFVPRGTNSKIQNKLFHVEQFDKEDICNCSTWNNLIKKTYAIVPRGTILQNTLFIFIVIGFIQAIIGIWQFIKQSSVGLFWLKESIISPQILGVAKVILHGQTYVRAYGLFPHPNILGGFLVFSIIATLLYIKLFHVEQFDKKLSHNCSTWNNLIKNLATIVPRGTIVLYAILTTQSVALLLTFSKSAIIGLLMGLFYIYIKTKKEIVPRGTISNIQTALITNTNCSTWNNFTNTLSVLKYKLFHVEQFKRKLILITGIIILIFVIIKPDIYSLLFKSLQERGFYLNVSRGTFLSNPLLGIGSGQFITNMAKIYAVADWQYQPVHNVFLLILNEFGIFLLFGFLFFLYKLFHVEQFKELNQIVPRGTIAYTYIKGVLIAFIFIMLFDHYFWDIQQGSLILWIVLGICTSLNMLYNRH